MNLSIILKSLQLLNHIAMIYYIINTQVVYQNVWVSIIICQLLLIVGVSAGLHRYLTHKSFATSKFWEIVMLWVSVPATIGTPLSWAGTHRLHHAFSDTTKDPHSPKVLGLVKSYLHMWNKITIPSALVSDILKNKTAKYIHMNYLKILTVYIITLYTINPVLGVLIYSIPAVLVFHITGIINSLGHGLGYRNSNTKDTSTNSKFIALFTAGEGLHNNHHAYPKSPIFSIKKYEIDITQYFIKMIRI